MKSSDDVSPDVRKFFDLCMARDHDYQCVEARPKICQRLEVHALVDNRQFSSTCRSTNIKANREVHVTIR